MEQNIVSIIIIGVVVAVGVGTIAGMTIPLGEKRSNQNDASTKVNTVRPTPTRMTAPPAQPKRSTPSSGTRRAPVSNEDKAVPALW